MPILALKCRLQVEQVTSEINDSDEDPLAVALFQLGFKGVFVAFLSAISRVFSFLNVSIETFFGSRSLWILVT